MEIRKDSGSCLKLGVDLADTVGVQVDEEVCVASKNGVELAGSSLALGKTGVSRTESIGEIRCRGPATKEVTTVRSPSTSMRIQHSR